MCSLVARSREQSGNDRICTLVLLQSAPVCLVIMSQSLLLCLVIRDGVGGSIVEPPNSFIIQNISVAGSSEV